MESFKRHTKDPMKPYPLFLFKSKTFNHLHNYTVVLGLFKTERGKDFFHPLSIVPTLTVLFARCREGPAGRAAVAQHLRPHLHHRLHLLTHRLQDCQEKVFFPPTDLLWLKYSFVERTILHWQEQQTRDSSQLPQLKSGKLC